MKKNIDYEYLWSYLQNGEEIWAPNEEAYLGTWDEGKEQLVVEVNGPTEFGIGFCRDIEDLPRIVNDFIGVGGTIGVINKALENKKASVAAAHTDFETDQFVVCGINPRTENFFVGTKSVFNKDEPKIASSEGGIDMYYGEENPNLAKRLKLCFKYFPELGIKGVLGGDFLAQKSDLKTENVNEEELYTFSNQSIKYGIPVDHQIGKKIKDAEVTILFNTTYLPLNSVDDSVKSMKEKAGFFEILNDTKSVLVLTKEEVDNFMIS